MKISTTNVRKKDGTKLVNGYKICLKKSEVERNGMSELTDLVPTFQDGRIILTEVGRIFVDYHHKGELWCWSYRKAGDNLYDKDTFVFKTGEQAGKEIEKAFKDNPLPEDMLELSNRSGNLMIIWDGKKYPRDLNYQ